MTCAKLLQLQPLAKEIRAKDKDFDRLVRYCWQAQLLT